MGNGNHRFNSDITRHFANLKLYHGAFILGRVPISFTVICMIPRIDILKLTAVANYAAIQKRVSS
jgi:hypothetical protein